MQKSLMGLGVVRSLVAASLAIDGVNSPRNATFLPPMSLKVYMRRRISSPALAATSSWDSTTGVMTSS